MHWIPRLTYIVSVRKKARNVIWDDPLKGGEIGQCDRGQVTHTQSSDTHQIILPHASTKEKRKKAHPIVRCPSPDFDSKGGHYTHKEHFLSPASQLVTVRFELAPFPEERTAEGTQQHRIQTLLSTLLLLNKSDCCQETITAQDIRQIQPRGRSVNVLCSKCLSVIVCVHNICLYYHSKALLQ